MKKRSNRQRLQTKLQASKSSKEKLLGILPASSLSVPLCVRIILVISLLYCVFSFALGISVFSHIVYIHYYGHQGFAERAESIRTIQRYLSVPEASLCVNSSDSNTLDTKDSQENTLPLTERECEHMSDVKGLFKLDRMLFYTFLTLFGIVIIIYSIYTKLPAKFSLLLAKDIRLACILGFGILLALAILSLFNFTSLFYGFHELLFNNDLWLLPENSFLIQLFPEDFFAYMAMSIGAIAAFVFAAFFAISKASVRCFSRL